MVHITVNFFCGLKVDLTLKLPIEWKDLGGSEILWLQREGLIHKDQ